MRRHRLSLAAGALGLALLATVGLAGGALPQVAGQSDDGFWFEALLDLGSSQDREEEDWRSMPAERVTSDTESLEAGPAEAVPAEAVPKRPDERRRPFGVIDGGDIFAPKVRYREVNPLGAAPSAKLVVTLPDAEDSANPQDLFQALQNRGERPDRKLLGLYMMDLETKQVVPVANEPNGEFTYYGSPDWSSDGSRIVYDATPGSNYSQTHIMLVELHDDGIVTTDLGPGNCPSFSPDGKKIAFLLNPGAIPDARWGMWIMNADGTRRQRLGDGSVPEWSPAGNLILNATFSSPLRLSLLDADDGEAAAINFPGHRIYSIPNWIDGDTFVALVVTPEKEGILLVNVANPAQPRIERMLLRTDEQFKSQVKYPAYSPARDVCVFARKQEEGMSLYYFKRGEEPTRMEPERGYDEKIASLVLSPDGRYLLFCSSRNVE